MPNNKQANKRLRQDEVRRQRNKAVKSNMRSAVKKVVQAESTDEAQAVIPEAMKRIDKAAKKNVIHQNTAARMKSRITRAAAKK